MHLAWQEPSTPLSAKDWELIRVFDGAEIVQTELSSSEANLSAALDLDGAQTRQVLHLASMLCFSSCTVMGF